MSFDHTLLKYVLNERLNEALSLAHRMSREEIQNCDPTCVSELVRQYLVQPIELSSYFIGNDIFELTNSMSDHKSGKTGLFAYYPFSGEKKWIDHVRHQQSNSFPLAFSEEVRIRMVIMFDPETDDKDTLRCMIEDKAERVDSFIDSVNSEIESFNKNIADQVIAAVSTRRESIWKTQMAIEGTGLPAEFTGAKEQREKEIHSSLERLKNALSGATDGSQRLPRVFIVHGRDNTAKLELKNYLQNSLKLGEPVILHEQPSQGKTILEKFENYANEIDLVFVLMTPDDTASLKDSEEESESRARQNVILEMGYFLAKLKPESGRVICLYKKGVALPSDLDGLVYIDISAGIMAAGEEIRRELNALGISV